MPQGTGTPNVTVDVATGNLRRAINVIDGVAGIVGTANTIALIGAVKTVFSYDDALAKGYTAIAEPLLNANIKQFYDELGGNQELWLMGVEDTMTMEDMVESTNANGVKKLLAVSQGRVNLVGICRLPDGDYAPGAGFLDVDVNLALLASKALCQYQQSINRPVRLFIEGRVNDIEIAPYSPNTATNGYAGVVLGNNRNDGSAAIGLALGRACKFGAHVKIGNGQNGALSITAAFIGEKAVEEFFPAELDVFADKGYIILHTREGSAGYYFGRDNMATTDDFRILVHGRLIDKAHRIATATSTPFLETSVRLTAQGKINEADAKYLEDTVRQQLLAGMAGQISDAEVIVPIDQDLVNTSTLGQQVKILPLGYLTWITITLGLTNTI